MNCPHCDTEIDEHEANRCLDAWVAEAVMGWRRSLHLQSIIFQGRVWGKDMRAEDASDAYITDDDLPLFSIEIAAAWEVVGCVWVNREEDFFLEYWSDGEFFVATKPTGVREGSVRAHCDGKKTGKLSAPLAICRAALKAA